MNVKTLLVLLFVGMAAMLPAALGHAAEEEAATVEPGLVEWHESFEAACTASQESGKPVLLFQLLGRLDAADT